MFYERGGKRRAEFGEFDAILASSEKFYLIESKWDNFSENKNDEIKLSDEEVLRHKILSWFLRNWDAQKYSSNWAGFENGFQSNCANEFPDRKIAPAGSHLAKDLEFVLNKLQEHCRRFSSEYREPRNVLLYFHGNKSREIKRVAAEDLNFEVVNINYSQYISGNFITLDC